MPVNIQSVQGVNTAKTSPRKISKKNSLHDKKPITRAGETSLLVKGTFFSGIAVGARLLFGLFDGEFVGEMVSDKAEKIVNKNNKNLKGWKKEFMCIGATAALIGVVLTGFSLIYTAFNAPKIAYKSKVNQFKKGKEMDVYIQANKAERELYSQISKKALTADEKEKVKLRENYMQLKLAKNNVPDFVHTKPILKNKNSHACCSSS